MLRGTIALLLDRALLIASLGLVTSLLRSAFTLRPASEKLDGIRLNLGGVFLHTALVLIAAGAKTALDINLGSLVDKPLSHIGVCPPSDDVVPFGVLPEFTAAVLESFGGCKRKGGNLHISFEVTYFRISANVTDQHYFVK